MNFSLKVVLLVIIVGCISILCMATHVFDDKNTDSPTIISSNYTSNPQSPYVMQYTSPTPTVKPTPTPLYYEKIEYPTEPCSQTLEIFNTHCMGRTKDEGYCDYWEYQTRKNCIFIQW